jgi:7,8-dihydro-6-hydroxymethylpterin-pyrophosphokinase
LPAPSEPRTLDIDILLYEDQVIAEDRLQIPQPLLHLRRFVLVPLADIAPRSSTRRSISRLPTYLKMRKAL